MKKDFFTDGEKIRCFDEICACFYEKNFGRLSKADMDMMMFRFYLQKMVDASKEKEGGLIDYRKCSDIKMAKELGITPARVRSLKTRVQFASPIAYDWKRQFALLTPNADYDPASMTVSLHGIFSSSNCLLTLPAVRRVALSKGFASGGKRACSGDQGQGPVRLCDGGHAEIAQALPLHLCQPSAESCAGCHRGPVQGQRCLCCPW